MWRPQMTVADEDTDIPYVPAIVRYINYKKFGRIVRYVNFFTIEF